MAAVTLFEEFGLDLGNGDHGDLNAASFKMALLKAAAAPTAADLTPTYSDYSANEVNGTNYTAGGVVITGTGYTESGGTSTLAATSAAWTSLDLTAGADSTLASYGLIYNDTATGDPAIGFINFGTTVGGSGGDLTVTFTNSKIFDLS